MVGHDHLPPVRVSPFLMTAALTGEREAVLLQNLCDFSRGTDREPLAHGSASSRILAPCGNATSAGSNQRANASFAFAMASSSVSPELAHPGSSGKTADQRFTSESNSMTRRNFTRLKHTGSVSFCTLQISPASAPVTCHSSLFLTYRAIYRVGDSRVGQMEQTGQRDRGRVSGGPKSEVRTPASEAPRQRNLRGMLSRYRLE
jgi:hypothetical protein